tara:strand:+ start:188 stop:427 length:240 start_codon:yes stop_codon:yes gene_type:complete
MSIESGIGSMSGMLIIISIIAIGAVMAVRNKIANKKRRRTQATTETQTETSQPQPEQSTEQTDVDSLLDKLKEDSNKQD